MVDNIKCKTCGEMFKTCSNCTTIIKKGDKLFCVDNIHFCKTGCILDFYDAIHTEAIGMKDKHPLDSLQAEADLKDQKDREMTES